MNDSVKMEKVSVLLMLVLTVITLGIYPWYWFVKCRTEITSTGSSSRLKVSHRFVVSFLVLAIARVGLKMLQVLTGEARAVSGPFLGLRILVLLIGAVGLYGWFASAFSLRSTLEQHFQELHGPDVRLSKWLTFFFGVYYLQFKINRLLPVAA